MSCLKQMCDYFALLFSICSISIWDTIHLNFSNHPDNAFLIYISVTNYFPQKYPTFSVQVNLVVPWSFVPLFPPPPSPASVAQFSVLVLSPLFLLHSLITTACVWVL